MATLKDVAKKANVSIATVSNALNNTKFVSPEVKERIFKAIEETGYIPNNVARSLKIKKTKTVGMIVTYIENPVYSGMFRELEQYAREKGYSVIVTNSNDNPDVEAQQIELLLSKQVDGLIIVPAKNSRIFQKKLIPPSFPLVFLNRKIKENTPSIVIENKKASYEAVSHLIERHHLTRIAIVIGEKTNQLSKERKEGYITALRDHQLDVSKDLEFEGHSTFQGGIEAAQKMFLMKNPPEAVFVTGTTMLLGVMFQLKKMGIRCPEEIAIIGFSDTNINLLLDPPVSAIAQPIEQLAKHSLEALLEQIEQQMNEPKEVVLPCAIHYRRSCGCNWEPVIKNSEGDVFFKKLYTI